MASMNLSRQPLMQEIFTTAQRVTQEAGKRGHRVGEPLSLETGWDFMKGLDRKAAYNLIEKTKPYFLVVAYPCGPWSPLIRLRPAANLEQIRQEHRVLIQFALKLARLQKKNHCHFILENPIGSASWSLPEVVKFLEEEEARLAKFDQCRFNLRSEAGMLHKKGTQMATSSEAMHRRLDGVRCSGDHLHQQVIGGSRITERAGHYPQELARAMVLGMEEEFESQFCQRPHSVLAAETSGADDSGGEDETVQMVDVPSASSDEDLEVKQDGIKISQAVKQAVKRLHENTAHRSNKRLARALVISGASPEVVRAARLHKCSVCQEMRAPKSQRPASLPIPKNVSD